MRADDEAAIAKLNDRFCYELDRGTPEGFAALFTDDVIYTHGARTSHGRAEVLAFARGRRADGPRTSRHFAAGLVITFEAEDRATGLSCCVTYAASMEPPIPTTAPALVADFADVYRKQDGVWRFAERHITPIFTPAPKPSP